MRASKNKINRQIGITAIVLIIIIALISIYYFFAKTPTSEKKLGTMPLEVPSPAPSEDNNT